MIHLTKLKLQVTSTATPIILKKSTEHMHGCKETMPNQEGSL